MKMLHVHDILDWANQSGKSFSIAELKVAVAEVFGPDASFSSCSVDGMGGGAAVDFLVSRGKFSPKQSGSHVVVLVVPKRA